MRISDWSSDVCSSDLIGAGLRELRGLRIGRLASGRFRIRSAGGQEDRQTDNAEGTPQKPRKRRTHHTAEQDPPPNKGTVSKLAAATSRRLTNQTKSC